MGMELFCVLSKTSVSPLVLNFLDPPVIAQVLVNHLAREGALAELLSEELQPFCNKF